MRKSSIRRLSGMLSLVMLLSLGGQAIATAAPPKLPHEPQQEKAVPVRSVPVKAKQDDAAGAVAMHGAPEVSWPAGVLGTSRSDVRAEVLDRAATAKAGMSGLLVRVRGAATPVELTVDYGKFKHAFGGDWGHRLRLVRLADKAVVPSRNDTRAATLTAQVEGGDAMYAVTAGPSGSTGDYTATPLALSSTWQVSGQTGDFAWKYPLRMPETPGGLSPQLGISYSSGAVDGRTASTNNQPSWIGEGFDLWSGYIERSYRGCADDLGGNQGQTKTGDQCWFSENATMSLAGRSGQLVRDEATGVWKLKSDDGTRIEKLTGAANGDNDGEHWRVTTRDGIQYHFGLNRLPGWTAGNPETQSAWQAPVFGNNPGEPCYVAAYASSWCQQTYRWNLDYVVDPKGNSLTYYYAKERNSYGLNMGKQTVAYDRGGFLLRAEFGTRRGSEYSGTAPARVMFTTAARCVPGANCSVHNPQSYPDVPFDQECSANCTQQVSPTFWTTKRLESVAAFAGTHQIEKWTLSHSFPAPGDGTNAGLWLNSINHSGEYLGSVAVPPVKFSGQAMANRVNGATDGLPPLNKYRIVAVHNEFGGVIGVNYAGTNCVAGALPAPDTNTLRCFPMNWQPEGGQPLTDWMHKYVVASVVQVDGVGGSPTEVTSYGYQGGGAWHYNDNELVKPDKRTWSEWRGYERVVIAHGESKTEYRYFRGMNGDKLAGGGTKSVSVQDSKGVRVTDDDQLNGVVRETTTYNGANGPVVGTTINDVWQRGPTAVRGSLKAFMVETGGVLERTALPGNAWRETRVTRSYNNDALVTQIDDHGDLGVTGDEECTRNWYSGHLPTRVQAVAVSCSAPPVYPRDTISDIRNTYDGVGNPTKVEQVADYANGQPVYVTTNRTTFDAYGRPLDAYDALDRKTTTAYTETAGLTTKITITNAAGHVTATELSPAWGEPLTSFDPNGRRTDVRYDALGRVTGVWLAGRSEPAGEGPNLRYRYLIRSDGPSAISTDTLRANGNYVTNHALYDGFLRPRQTQSPAWGGGRVITDTVYDSRGLKVKDNGRYYAEGTPGTTLVAAGDNNIPSQTLTVYDGTGRSTASVFRSFGVEKWRSTTSYHGNRIDHTPPPGGTPTKVHVDARGRTTQLHQGADVTTYAYGKTGQMTGFTDPAGLQWRYEYDLRGRRIATHDPDKGTTLSTYDAAGQQLTATDARGKTVAFTYDALGRKTSERDGTATGPLLAKWTYDTLLKGLPTSSTRIQDGAAYTTAVVGYDSANRPTGTKVTIPVAEGALAGTYQTGLTYRPDGSVASMALPRAGDLAPETVTYEYDDLGLPKASAYVNDTWYTRFGEPAQLSMGGTGARVWNTTYYDEATRRLSRSLVEREKSVGSQVNDFRYEYDAAGNVLQIFDVPEGGPGDRQCFAYDNLRRMTSAWTTASTCEPGSAGGASPYWTSYRFDRTGNRAGETQHLSGVTRSYEYASESHALRSVTTTGPNGSAVDTFSHDATGNVVARNLGGTTQTLDWDGYGRLRSAGATTFAYDAPGERLLRRDPDATTLYLGAQEIRLDRATGVKRGTRYYSHGSSVIAVRNADGLFWKAGDHHNTTTTVIKSGTLEVARRLFTPFGEARGAAQGAWPDDRSFVGGTRDDSVGLVHLGAREYDPALGRFISVDPVIDPSDPQQLNGYAYANNSPATYSDPDGLFPECGCPSDRYGYDNVLHNADGSLLSEADANKYLNPKQKSKWNQKAQWKQQRDKARGDWERKVKASGHSTKEYDEAKKIKQRSVLDVVVEAGGDVLMEFLGINDIKGCFGEGDLGSCISMVINVIPWTKVFKLGSLIGAVKKAWNAVMNFRDKRKWADEVVNAVDTSVKSCHSFRRETKVRLADGSHKPIGEVKLGDKVLATDPSTGKTEAREVVAVHVNTDHDFVDLNVRGAKGEETLYTTGNHPFWSEKDSAWVEASSLRAGDLLVTPSGARVPVTTVRAHAGEQVMYDLTVDGLHTYYVAAGGSDVLVHNTQCKVHPIPGYRDPRAEGPCACRGGAQEKGAPERHPGEGKAEQRHTSAEAGARAVKGMDDALANGDNPVVAMALGAGAVAAGVKAGWQRVRSWWRDR